MSDNPIKTLASEARMVEHPIKVMAVDDEEFNLEILMKHLKKGGYESVGVEDGEKAWQYLTDNPGDVNIILLDKMMPKMSGMELLGKIKSDPELKHIIVIMQTASVGAKELIEGIDAGAYYYLTKPYAAEVLMSIVDSAARDYRQNHQLLAEVQKKDTVRQITKGAEFELKTMEEARALAAYLANFFDHPSRIMVGLAGLMQNAVEHGNLGVGYELKQNLLTGGEYDKEISRRLALPENVNKSVRVSLNKEGPNLSINILDEGDGFDPAPYMDFDPSRITDPNGRGIAMANIMTPGRIEYSAKGNEVKYTIDISAGDEGAGSEGGRDGKSGSSDSDNGSSDSGKGAKSAIIQVQDNVMAALKNPAEEENALEEGGANKRAAGGGSDV